jgi:hypothetical protein
MFDPLAERIAEGPVAQVLGVIAAPSNRRLQPIEGDLPGDFDYWFDGGACKLHTGTMLCVFSDGTRVHSVFPAPWLNLNIVFPDGNIVDVLQRRSSADSETGAAAIRMDCLEGT